MSKRTALVLLVLAALCAISLNYLFWDWFVTSRCGCN